MALGTTIDTDLILLILLPLIVGLEIVSCKVAMYIYMYTLLRTPKARASNHRSCLPRVDWGVLHP